MTDQQFLILCVFMLLIVAQLGLAVYWLTRIADDNRAATRGIVYELNWIRSRIEQAIDGQHLRAAE